MSWQIVYTASARQDLRDIHEYISGKLLEPRIAEKQLYKIMNAIRELDFMPYRYRLYTDEPWHSLGLRYFPVGNYLVFYHPKEEARVVTIVRIMYGGREVLQQLPEDIL